jgi:hypothetical protein
MSNKITKIEFMNRGIQYVFTKRENENPEDFYEKSWNAISIIPMNNKKLQAQLKLANLYQTKKQRNCIYSAAIEQKITAFGESL